MNLPNASRAQVEFTKVRDYLLSDTHPIGRMKAGFFSSLGFGLADPDLLATALENLAAKGEVVDQVSTKYGTKYVLDGALQGPQATAHVRTVWILESEGGVPRLVTAYPAPGKGDPR